MLPRIDTRLLWFVLVTGVSGLIGCDSCRDSQSTESAAKVRMLVREGLEAPGLRQVAEEWGRQRSVEVSVDALGRANYETVLRTDLQSPTPTYDVVFLPGTQVAEFASKGLIAPIDGFRIEDNRDLLTTSNYHGAVYGLPCDISTFFTFYRSDVVPAPPDTWEDLLVYGRRWDANEGGRPKYAFAFATEAGEELPKVFYPILWSYGGYILENGSVGLDSAESIRAAQMFKDLAAVPAAPREQWNVIKILDELQAGSIALSTPQWNALAPLLWDSSAPAARLIKMAPIPAAKRPDGSVQRVGFQHTWVLVRPARAKNRDLANDLILYATGPEGARLYAKTSRGNPARRTVLQDPEMQRIRPDFPLLLQSLEFSRAEPEVPYYSDLHRLMNASLSSMLSGTMSPPDAMRQAATNLRALTSRTDS